MLLFDPEKDDIENIFVVEIFTKGGATPPNEQPMRTNFFMCWKEKAMRVAR